MEDRILKIVTAIVEIMTATDDPAEVDRRLVADLFSRGYSAREISTAFGLLTQAVGTLKIEAGETLGARRESGCRALSRPETIRMTDDAIELFDRWRALDLLTPGVREEILRQVVAQETGAVDAEELERIARGAAGNGTDLQLFLDAENQPRQ